MTAKKYRNKININQRRLKIIKKNSLSEILIIAIIMSEEFDISTAQRELRALRRNAFKEVKAAVTKISEKNLIGQK